MRDLGLTRIDEPFANLLTQGMVLNHIYYRKNEKGGLDYIAPAEVEVKYDAHGSIDSVIAKRDGQPVKYGGIGTMSKSKNNGVDPQTLIEKYGADTARFFMMFASPPEQTLEWSDSGVEGAFRFLKRLWSFAQENKQNIKRGMQYKPDWSKAAPEQKAVRFEIHTITNQANHDLEKFQFNTVASACMKILNSLEKTPAAIKAGKGSEPSGNIYDRILCDGTSILLRLLSPISPHISDYLWRELGYGDDILGAPWPFPDPEALIKDEIELVVQVNGKVRGRVLVSSDATKQEIEQKALAEENVKRFTDEKNVKRIIIVPGRLVNIVVS